MLGGHTRDEHIHHFALEQLLITADQRAVDGAQKVADGGCDQ